MLALSINYFLNERLFPLSQRRIIKETQFIMSEKRFSPAFKTYNKKFKYSFTFGIYPTLDLLKMMPDKALKFVFMDEAKDNAVVGECMEICRREDIPYEFNGKLIDRVATKENTYAVGAFEKYYSELEKNKDHLVLVEPRDMGNIGTIIRAMAAFNVYNLAIIRPAADIFDPRAVRSAMGSLFRVNFEYFDNYTEYHRAHKNHNLYPFVLDQDAKKLSETTFSGLKSLVFGNEGHGLPDEISSIGTKVMISQSPHVDSLNLSVSVGIALWEAYKQSA